MKLTKILGTEKINTTREDGRNHVGKPKNTNIANINAQRWKENITTK